MKSLNTDNREHEQGAYVAYPEQQGVNELERKLGVD